MVSKGQFVGLDWKRIARLHSQVMTGTQELTNSIALSQHIKMQPTNLQSEYQRGSCVQIPSGTRIFSELSLHIKFKKVKKLTERLQAKLYPPNLVKPTFYLVF